MFIAMNRFRVKKGSEDAFEKVWLGRDSYLDGVLGFLEFHLLKGPGAEDHTLYSSHTVWQSKRAFEAWTKIGTIQGRPVRNGFRSPAQTVRASGRGRAIYAFPAIGARRHARARNRR
jgi:hypothetical protein